MAEDKLEKNHYPYVSDGIVNPKRFYKPGILFIMKEVNRDKKKGNWDLRTHLLDGGKAASWNNISIWIYGLFGLRNFEDINFENAVNSLKNGPESFRKEMLGQIAVMNLKKTPGGGSTKNKSLKDYVKENHQELPKQFNSLIQDIDLVICCGKPTGSLLRKYVFNLGDKESYSI